MGIFSGAYISFMDAHHVLLHLANEKDYLHAWAREGRVVAGCAFHLFNWNIDLDVQKEPLIEAQWIFLPGLPLLFYRLDYLQIFGNFLGTDNATIYQSRATGHIYASKLIYLKNQLRNFL